MIFKFFLPYMGMVAILFNGTRTLEPNVKTQSTGLMGNLVKIVFTEVLMIKEFYTCI